MLYEIERECPCGRMVIATVRVSGGGRPYGIGESGPPGAVFEDAPDIELVSARAFHDDGTRCTDEAVLSGVCPCGEDHERALIDHAAEKDADAASRTSPDEWMVD